MNILLPNLAVAFAAFCVWLTVRIVNRRERWAKWTAFVIALPVLYIASIGPAAWIARDSKPGDWGWDAFHGIYYPLQMLDADYGLDYEFDGPPEFSHCGGSPHPAIRWYMGIWGGGPHPWLDM